MQSTAAFSQQKPDDVARISSSMESVKILMAGSTGDAAAMAAVADTIHDAAVATVRSVVEYSNIEREIAVRQDEFDTSLRSKWIGELRAALSMKDRSAKYEALSAVLREASSRSVAEEWLAGWLGVPTSTSLIGSLPARDDTLVWRGSSLQGQIAGTTRTRDLFFIPEETSLVAESGGTYGGNRVIDAGEWVRIRFTLGNDSATPYFSSSVWLRSLSPCLWTDAVVEHEVEEMSPRGGRGSFGAWFYVSSQCPSGRPVKLRASLRDTHQTSAAGISLDMEIVPHGNMLARLNPLNIDSDTPGSSDATDNPVLHPGHSYEVSVGVQLSRKPHFNPRSVYGASDETRALFDGFSHRSVDMIGKGVGTYAAGDDLDLKVVAEESYKSRAYSLRKISRWAEKKNGPMIWLAVDTEVLDVPPGWKRSSPSGSGDARRELTPDDIVKMVLAHVTLESRRSSPTLSGAVAATDGHEVVFDVDGYRAAYEAATGPLPDSVELEITPVVRYVYRHFVPLRIASMEIAPAPVPRPAPVKYRPKYRPPPPPPEPEFIGLVRLDLGLEFSKLPFEKIDAGGDDVWLTGISPQLSVGQSWCFVANIDIHSGSFKDNNGHEYSPKQFMVWAGLGHILGAGGTIEFEPALQLGAGQRAMGDLTQALAGIGASGTARVFFSDHVGFFGEMKYDITTNGPPENGEDTLNGNQFKIGFGLSGRF